MANLIQETYNLSAVRLSSLHTRWHKEEDDDRDDRGTNYQSLVREFDLQRQLIPKDGCVNFIKLIRKWAQTKQ